MKIYTKKGAKNYKESRLISEIEDAILKDPTKAERFKKSATNFDELKALHTEVVSETVSYEDIPAKGEKKIVESDEPAKDSKSSAVEDDGDMMDDSNSNMIDPFNREEPIVRDYVLHDELQKELQAGKTEGPARTSFAEPVTFDESFTMPSDDVTDKKDGKAGEKKEPKKEGATKSAKSDPINPSFNDMSGSRKKRSTKRFAKNIVEAVIKLTHEGVVWFANKDINEAKLVEYDLDFKKSHGAEGIDLSLLLELSEGQTVTIKEFFQSQCLKAETLVQMDEEDKKDMIEILAEVLEEKGFAPTPMQELMMLGGKWVLGIGLNVLKLVFENNSVIVQAKKHSQTQDIPHTEVKEEPKREEPPAPAPMATEPEKPTPTTPSAVETLPEDGEIIDKEIKTKE